MARGPEGVRLRIEEICSKFYDEINFRRRGRCQRFTDCSCCGCSCGGRAESQRVRSIGKPPMCRSVSCGDNQYHEKDGVSRPAPGLMRKIYPREKRAHKRVPEMNASASPAASGDDCYDGVKNPYILLINNVNFHTMPAPRGGAVADIENLLEFFRDSGFKSIVDRYDLLQEQMRALLENTRTNPDLLDHDAFICVIMTHGDAEGLKGVDDWRENSIKVERITSMFTGDKCPQLMTKPKLFFIQACRGKEEDGGSVVPRGQSRPGSWVTDSEGEREMVVKLPSEADILVAYSTTKYHVSYRKLTDNARAMVEHREEMGSWFISCMVQVFKAHSHAEDLMTMMAKVNRAMTQLYTGGDPISGNKQISCQLSMLTKKLYFAKYWEQRRHHR